MKIERSVGRNMFVGMWLWRGTGIRDISIFLNRTSRGNFWLNTMVANYLFKEGQTLINGETQANNGIMV